MKILAGLLVLIIALTASGTFLPDPIYSGDNDGAYPSPDDFIKVDVMPEMTYQATPEYPSKAKKSGLEGTVQIKSLINRKGGVVQSLIAESSGSDLLDKVALKAAGECRYSPARNGGKPVAVWIQYKTEFSLDDCESDELLELSRMPEFLYQPPPVYPEKAKKDGIEGTVQMKVLVSKIGQPAKIEVVESSCNDCGFAEAAIAAAKQYKFKPGMMDGKPVASWIAFEVSFRLR